MTKLCVDCRHHQLSPSGKHLCRAFDYVATSPVTGASRDVRVDAECSNQRSVLSNVAAAAGFKTCGPEGRRFEAKAEEAA